MLPQQPPPNTNNVVSLTLNELIALISQTIRNHHSQSVPMPNSSTVHPPTVQQPQIVPNFAHPPPQIQQNLLAAPSNLVFPIGGQTAAQSHLQIVLPADDCAQQIQTVLDLGKELMEILLRQQQQQQNSAQPIPLARPTKTATTTAPQPQPLLQQQSQNTNALSSSLFSSTSASTRPTKTAKRRKLKVKAASNVAAPVNLQQQQNLNNNNVQNVGPIYFFHNFSIRSSAKRVLVNWEVPPDLPIPTTGKYKIHLVVTSESEQFESGICGGRKRKCQQLELVLDRFYASHVRQSQFNATPGSWYSIELSVVNSRTNEIVIEDRRTAKAVFSTEEMQRLLDKAIEFAGPEMHPFTHLYRCKPQSYWDAIGPTMEVYVKDNNGQAASPINQNIRGLFFMASLKQDGNLPDFSPFGNVRMTIPAECLLAPYWVNLYFSDFYCYNPSKQKHYVQLVVTLQNSVADNFCRQQKLPELDLFDNPFLRFSRSQQMYLVNKHKNVWVEVFYTENVERSEYWYFDTVQSRGEYGEGLTTTAQHNKHCLHCNLYRTGAAKVPPAPQPPVQFAPLPAETADAMVREAESAELVDSPSFDPANEQSNGFYEGDTFEESTETKENADLVCPTQCPNEVPSAEVNQTEDLQPYNPNWILGTHVNDSFYFCNPFTSIFGSFASL